MRLTDKMMNELQVCCACWAVSTCPSASITPAPFLFQIVSQQASVSPRLQQPAMRYKVTAVLPVDAKSYVIERDSAAFRSGPRRRASLGPPLERQRQPWSRAHSCRAEQRCAAGQLRPAPHTQMAPPAPSEASLQLRPAHGRGPPPRAARVQVATGHGPQPGQV